MLERAPIRATSTANLSIEPPKSLPSNYDFIQSLPHAPLLPLVSSIGRSAVSVRIAPPLSPIPQTRVPSNTESATHPHTPGFPHLRSPENLLISARKIVRALWATRNRPHSHGD